MHERSLQIVISGIGPFLLVILVLFVITLLGILPLDTARSATTEWRLQAEVNVLLGIQTNNKGGNIDNLRIKIQSSEVQ